jgi:membrane protease YdiL (CAAX protease family)
VRLRPSLHIAAAVALAALAWIALPGLASRVVASRLAAEGAADRAAYARGASPWAWHLARADDVVASRVFGDGSLRAGPDGLMIVAHGDRPLQVGLPIAREVDLTGLDCLQLDMSGPATARYALLVRQALAGPLLRAPFAPGSPVRLTALPWVDETGRPHAAPTRAAMIRLELDLHPGDAVRLSGASLVPSHALAETSGLRIPGSLSAEALLRWRDRQHAIRPLATFGDTPPSATFPDLGWPVAAGYGVLLLAGASRFRRAATARARDAALVVFGPLWLIAGMRLSPHPSAVDVAVFGAGVAYAAFLAWRRVVPAWRWWGDWRMAGWPLLAIPVAVGLVAVAGHTPVWPSPGRMGLYLAWALFQQWLLLVVAGGILAQTLPRPLAVLLTALVFALLHLPNGLLMQLCFVAELGWAWWFVQRRTLLPVALAHSAAALVLQAGLAGGILRSLEVSARYLQ